MKKTKKERNLKFVDGKWFVDFTFDKKRIRQFGGYTKEQARTRLARLKVEKLDEKMGFKKPRFEKILFEEFAEKFIKLHSKENKKSWKRDEASLRSLKPFFKGKMLFDINPELVERYKVKRKSEVSPATFNRELAFMKTMFSKAVEWGRIESNPLQNVKKLKENSGRMRILKPEEMKRLLNVAIGYLKSILIIALNTGMRRGEILNLKRENINFSKRMIHIEDSKSGRSRNVPMNNLVVEALSVIPQNSEFVFFNPMTKQPIRDVKKSFKTACKKAEIKGLRFHDLRHTSATRMIESGADLVTVSKILGHSTVQMTMRYVNPDSETMKNAVDKLANFYEQTRQKVDKVEIRETASPLISSH